MASGERVLMTGNEAAAEGAIRAGCRFYFGYPITPQNDLPEYMARRMPEVGGTFIQAESELAAISMVHGASAAGARAMTSSSSPGISLKQEGLSYMAGSELPCLLVNVQRAGPGLGDVRCAQADYFQATRGGGHGDYYLPVLAPYTVQETFDLAGVGLNLAMKWRTPVLILSDQQVGQMMEPVDLPPVREAPEGEAPWALRGAAPGQERKYIHSYCGRVGELVAWNVRLKKKMEQIAAEEVRFEAVETADAEVVLVAYGTSARLSKAVVASCRRQGLRVGLLRPVTLWPFPTAAIRSLAGLGRQFLVVEMSWGQLVEDVRLAVEGRSPVDLLNTFGGEVVRTAKIGERVKEKLKVKR
jgi:2-oxoglutarate ferredoxin oxidoreductase subunit alpha